MNVKRVLTALIGFPLIMLIFIFGNKYIIDILLSIVGCFAIFEYFKACQKEAKNLSWIGYVLMLGIPFIHILSIKTELILLTILIPLLLLLLFLHIIISNMKINYKDIAFAFSGLCYITFFIVFVALIYGIGDTTKLSFINKDSLPDFVINSFVPNSKLTGKFLIWYLLFTAWGSDTFAYIIGKHFGKHKFSKVSPNKTVEGCLAGVLGAMIMSLIYTYIININLGINISYLKIALISAVLCVIGQIGDFAASCIKRYFEVKDFGEIFPGHGGMIDRIDSVMFIAPFAFCLFVFVLL